MRTCLGNESLANIDRDNLRFAVLGEISRGVARAAADLKYAPSSKPLDLRYEPVAPSAHTQRRRAHRLKNLIEAALILQNRSRHRNQTFRAKMP